MWSCWAILKKLTFSAFPAVKSVRFRVWNWIHDRLAPFHNPTTRTLIWFWKWQARSRYLRASVLLFFAVLRYRFLCFKYFGRFRLAIFVLKTPELLKAVFLALFAHPHDSTAPRPE